MTANLRIAVFGSCPILKTHSFENRILSEFFLNGEYGLLPFLFAFKFFLLFFTICVKCGIIGEKVKLFKNKL